MKKLSVHRVQTVTRSLITGAALLSAEEAEALPQHLRSYKDWWWLQEPGEYRSNAAFVFCDGSIYYDGCSTNERSNYVRPALHLAGLKSSGLMVGDRFEFGGAKFEIISDNRAFCLGDIGRHAFRDDWRAKDANVYEASAIKRLVDGWYFWMSQP